MEKTFILAKEAKAFPPDYRKSELDFFLNRIKHLDSSLLIGIPGVGKSVFLRFLIDNKNAQKELLNTEAARVIFCLIDLNNLSSFDEKSFFQLLLKNLERKCENIKIPKPDETIFLPRIQEVIDIICHQKQKRLAIIIDQFQIACINFPSEFFHNLKAIRDQAKDKLCYLFATAKDPLLIRPKQDYGPLYSLIGPFVFYFGPFDKDDGKWVLETLLTKHELKITPKTKEEILKLTAGHASMIKTVVNLLEKEHLQGKLEEKLMLDSGVGFILDEIWNSLYEEEKKVIKQITTDEKVDASRSAISKLLQKGILRKEKSEIKIFSKLFERFACEQSEPLEETVPAEKLPQETLDFYLDEERKIITIQGKEPSRPLTKLEFTLFSFFLRNPNKVFSRDEIAVAVWGKDEAVGVSNQAIDQIVSRLRKKIKQNGVKEDTIKTIRGRGYQFRTLLSK